MRKGQRSLAYGGLDVTSHPQWLQIAFKDLSAVVDIMHQRVKPLINRFYVSTLSIKHFGLFSLTDMD